MARGIAKKAHQKQEKKKDRTRKDESPTGSMEPVEVKIEGLTKTSGLTCPDGSVEFSVKFSLKDKHGEPKTFEVSMFYKAIGEDSYIETAWLDPAMAHHWGQPIQAMGKLGKDRRSKLAKQILYLAKKKVKY